MDSSDHLYKTWFLRCFNGKLEKVFGFHVCFNFGVGGSARESDKKFPLPCDHFLCENGSYFVEK